MPKLTDNASSDPENQQETSQVPRFFYYTGVCVGELSCSVIRANDNRGRGFFFCPDITISNADIDLLKEINGVIASNAGNISPIKGGYNLKFRSKRKVGIVLQFFEKYPVIAGDIAKTKLQLIRDVLPAIGKTSKVVDRLNVIERCRKDFKDLKLKGLVNEETNSNSFTDEEIGFFLAGIIDAEGSCGLKKSGFRKQPFFAVAMKDLKIIQLIENFIGCGNIHKRSDDGLYHWETNSKSDVLKIINTFMTKYPSKLKKMRDRMEYVRRILNDYMPRPQTKNWGDNIV